MPAKTTRIASIDAFRGFTMIAMLFANLEGGVFYPWFTHARTIPGFTFVDLIEPMFFLAIALSYMISFNAREQKFGASQAVWSTASRYLALMGLGFLTSWGDRFGFDFNWGTLQGIGLAGLCALPFVKAKPRAKLIAGLALVLLPGILFFFGEPAVVDFKGETSVPGLIASVFPVNDNMVGAVVKAGMLLVGIAWAQLLAENKKKAYIVLGGITLFAAGSLLAPSMWYLGPSAMSPSYCLVSLALSIAVYLLFRFLFDSRGLPCAPLLWWGRNSLLVYVISEVIGIGMAFGQTVPARLAFITAYVALMTLIVWLLDRKRWYVKL